MSRYIRSNEFVFVFLAVVAFLAPTFGKELTQNRIKSQSLNNINEYQKDTKRSNF